MSKKSKPPVAHFISQDAEHDQHGGVKAICGIYLPAGYDQIGPGVAGCLECVRQADNAIQEIFGKGLADLAEKHNGLCDSVETFRQTYNGLVDSLAEIITEAVEKARAQEKVRWVDAYDAATLRIERLEQRLDKIDRKKAKAQMKAAKR